MLDKAKSILNKYWGHQNFRGSQQNIISGILEGKDTLALMPTGGGKSVCYQVPSLIMEGICIVISPLIALMQNQVTELKNKGIKAVALTGGIPFEEVNNLLDNCLYGGYKFLYLSPERLQQPLVQERIKGMNINLIAIDEAHCISQWGNDFRPAYLQCALLKELAPKVPFLALTATATPKVVADIVQNLELNHPKIYKDSFSRDNIALSVEFKEDKRFRLKHIFDTHPGCSIVYVRSRRMSSQLSDYLSQNDFKATFFHGGISRLEKEKRLEHWLHNKVDIMVATNAFGMGVDKPDVQTVVHYQIPDSLESYFQEAGRAGRDGKAANAILLTNEADKTLAQKQFLESLPDATFLKRLYGKLNSYFQIAYGELSLESFPFPFAVFCKLYDFDARQTYEGLKILDQNSIISLSENFKTRTTIHFLADKHQIFSYLENHTKYQSLLQTILRTYGGILEYETKVNLPLIAKKTGLPETVVDTMLKEVQHDGIINYASNDSDFEINFLVPREDDLTINTFARKIKSLHRTKEGSLQAMLDFIDNSSVCRNRFLLKYFGEEQKENCGKCDICMKKRSTEPSNAVEEILNLLKKESLSSRKLVMLLGFEEKQVLAALKQLLEEEKIQLNLKNEYSLK